MDKRKIGPYINDSDKRVRLESFVPSKNIMSTVIMPGTTPVAMAPQVPRRRYRKSYYKGRNATPKWKLQKKIKSLYRSRRTMRDSMVALNGGRGTEGNISTFGKDWRSADGNQKVFRRGVGYRGDGDYDWSGLGRKIGHWGLRGLGAIGGGMTGMGVQQGWDVGAKLSQFGGFGDYGPVTTNQIVSGSGMSDQQQLSVNSNPDNLSGDIVITHTEFVQNVSVISSGAGTTSFQIQSFSLNPGLSTVFPFLSQLATNFTLFEFAGLMFQYKPTSGEFGSTNSNALGKVIMATNYDPDSSSFTGSQQMENYDYAQASKPSCGLVHGVETKEGQRFSNQLYVRAGLSTKDKVLTDLGLFQVATEGIYTGSAGTYVIGELWVTYKIKLSRANINDNSLGATILFSNNIQTINVSTVPGGQMQASSASTLPLTIANINTTTFRVTFPQNLSSGSFRVNIFAVLAAGIPVQSFGAVNTIVNATNYVPYNSGTYFNVPNAASTTTQQIGVFYDIIINAPGALQASFNQTIQGGALPAGTTLYVFLSQVNSLTDSLS